MRVEDVVTTGIPPAVTDETAPFWEAARHGRLLVERCTACGADTFPARGMCRACRGRDMAPVEVTGRGVVYSFTVNHQRWLPDLEVPYAIVLVEFPDHPGENIVIGAEVEVGFEPGPGGFAVPSFVAVDAAGGNG